MISEIPAADAAQATEEDVVLGLIEVGVLGREHAEKLQDRGLEALLAGDLGL